MKVFVLVMSALALLGCGPVMQTQYRYTPPSDPQARACLMQCQMGRQQCETIATQQAAMQYQTCELRAQSSYASCQASGNQFCVRQVCFRGSGNNAGCETNYNACYAACGGDVQSTQVCVRRCN